MTPRAILWHLPLAQGLQFVTLWWNLYHERLSKGGIVFHGIDCTRLIARKPLSDKLTG